MSDSDSISLTRPGTWPRRARLALEAIVTVVANAYLMARSHAAGSPSKTVRLMADRDDALWRAAIAERRCQLLRRRLLNMGPHRRALVLKDWYSMAHPDQALGGLAPEEAWSRVSLPETMAVRAHDPQPRFQVRRRRYGGRRGVSRKETSGMNDAAPQMRVRFNVEFSNGRTGHKKLRERRPEPKRDVPPAPSRLARLLALTHHFDDMIHEGGRKVIAACFCLKAPAESSTFRHVRWRTSVRPFGEAVLHHSAQSLVAGLDWGVRRDTIRDM